MHFIHDKQYMRCHNFKDQYLKKKEDNKDINGKYIIKQTGNTFSLIDDSRTQKIGLFNRDMTREGREEGGRRWIG